ncbi:hypothetical protein [Rubrobacter aplysinae]|uniref:hypothetical protein n=1 Tax=Rubrobacter aplysinae TaxID=909625 RepID=UPI00064C1071|nr:hypothetical protein [Rubrobacter aplysinae]
MQPETYDDASRTSQSIAGRDFARRHFLKIGATGVFSALTLGALGQSTAFAQGPKEPDSELKQEFEDAAEEFGVPVGVLSAMGYVNTRWEMPPPDASDYEDGETGRWGGYGIMALVRNPSTDTLSEAAQLTGISEEKLKTDRKSNIRGGAALLAESQKKQGRPTIERREPEKARKQGKLGREELKGWVQATSGRGAFRALGVEEEAPAPAGVGGGNIYEEQVSETLKTGASGKTEFGEQIRLQPE